MLATTFQRRRHAEHLVVIGARGGDHAQHFQRAAGYRPGLVERDRVNPSGLFQELTSFDQQAAPGAEMQTANDRHRR